MMSRYSRHELAYQSSRAQAIVMNVQLVVVLEVAGLKKVFARNVSLSN